MANPSNSKNSSKHLKIAVGTDNFKDMVTEYDVFVDKSRFIKEIVDSDEVAILITHPRRWGKTLNLDMLKVFFEPERNPECTGIRYYNPFRKTICNDEIFKKLAISSAIDGKGNNIISTYQGQNPVIFFSLKDIMGQSAEEIENKLKETITTVYEKYNYLKESSKLSDSEKIRFQKYIDQNYQGISIENSIKFLSELLHKHYGQKVYILIDEYDKPVNYLLEQYLGKDTSEVEKKLLSDTTKLITNTVCSSISKTNPHLKKLILTGIFDTLQKEFGSGCNNVKVFGISDSDFSMHFGFSEKEVRDLVTKFEFTNTKSILSKIKDWYDGYSVPVSIDQDMQAYTPWAVMNFLSDVHKKGESFMPQNYWTQSGASIILQKLLTKEACVKSVLSQKLQNIAEQNSVQLQFDQRISLLKYDWFANMDNEKFFSYLLLNSGYLTVRKDGEDYIFSIPNSELRQEFADVIPKENEKCQTILYNLQKVSQLKIVKMIKQNDTDGIQRELSESHIKCDDYSMNFNFFHLAAILGTKSVFNTFLKSDCAEYLDFANDKMSNLKSIDYAVLLNNTGVIEAIKEHYQDNSATLMQIPGWGETVLCFPYKSTSGSGLVSGVIDLAKDIILAGAAIPFKVAGYIGSALFGSHAGESLEKNCKQYSEYQEIDISSPKDFNSLIQFEKYILEHEKAYVVVNKDCKNQQEKVAELSYKIFENSFYSDEALKFVLCESNIGKSEL